MCLQQYLQAVATREIKAVESLKPPKQIALFCGPKLYRPSKENTLTALTWYQQLVDALIPTDTAIKKPFLWHNDLHDDNIFIDPENPEKITAIIDWQACHISPLFNNNPDPGFLAWDAGLEPETLSLVPKPKLTGLSQDERSTGLNEYKHHNVFIGWRKLMQARLPDLYQTVEFRKTPAYGLMFLAHRMFEYGDAHFQSLVVDLRDSWADLPAFHAGGASNVPKFPFHLSEADIQRIKRDGDAAEAGTDLVAEVKKKIGDLWPDKGFIERELYDECKAALDEARDCILEQLPETSEERAEYMDHWPFD